MRQVETPKGCIAMAKSNYLTDEDMARLAERGQVRQYANSDVIIQEGADDARVCWVKRGSIRIELSALYHGVVFRNIGAGEVVGEISFLDDGRPSATIVATEEVETLEISTPALSELLDSDTGLAARFYRTLAATLARRLRYESKEGWY